MPPDPARGSAKPRPASGARHPTLPGARPVLARRRRAARFRCPRTPRGARRSLARLLGRGIQLSRGPVQCSRGGAALRASDAPGPRAGLGKASPRFWGRGFDLSGARAVRARLRRAPRGGTLVDAVAGLGEASEAGADVGGVGGGGGQLEVAAEVGNGGGDAVQPLGEEAARPQVFGGSREEGEQQGDRGGRVWG